MTRLPRLAAALLLPCLFGFAVESQAQNATIRPGDMIEIRIAGVPPEEVGQFNQAYTVDESGMVNLPFIGQLKVDGQLGNQVQRTIEGRLKAGKIYTHPTITVTAINANRFVNVGGPGMRGGQRIVYTADLTLMTAINAAGGFNDFADRKNISLIREGKVYRYDARELLKNPTKDPAVQPGDQISVPMSMF